MSSVKATVPRSLSSISAVITAFVLAATGCAGLSSPGLSPGASGHVDLDSPSMRQFSVAQMTTIERDVRLETGEREPKRRKATPAVFWSGIGVGTVGAIGGVAFGVAGFMAKNQINAGYEPGSSLTLAERDRLARNGEKYNTLAISFTALAVIGYALAIVTYGVDWNRCGPLAEKRRRCTERGLSPD